MRKKAYLAQCQLTTVVSFLLLCAEKIYTIYATKKKERKKERKKEIGGTE